ncbi:MAG: hemerythrin domain-containing protein [Proteobacteria bacterium]|nr:hemerythrin domain-containing protein [Pseudomonadota bacterium]
MTWEDRSIERSIAEQHRRFDSMFKEILAALREGEPPEAIRDAFAQLREALESHIDQEDRLYYPSLRALRPADRSVLDGLAVAHDAFRTRLGEIDARLGARDLGDAERAIRAFGEAFAAHEATEERLLARIDAELAATASDR